MKDNSRIHRMFDSLAKADPLWTWLSFFILIVYVVSIFQKGHAERISLDTRLRWMGMLFQFAGLFGVIYGLRESRKIFNRPSFSSAIMAWVNELVGIFRKPTVRNINIETLGIDLALSIGSPRLTVPESLEEKVSRIERELGELEQHVQEGFKKIDRETKALVETERGTRAREIGRTNQMIETAIIGGINIELGGVLFLFLGVLLTSIPEWCVNLLKHILPL